ncbi:MAG: HAD-IIB family hydrolase [Proteobacteria bacterium]|nr:HAD-IIB family hydrolase [Pseudomonadota bacterium]
MPSASHRVSRTPASSHLRPLTELAPATVHAIRYVLLDIDDTLTTEGRLEAAAYGALERLQRAGFYVVPVTGRPAGWCDHIARMWPVAAVVGENGAFWFRYDRSRRRLRQWFGCTPAERQVARTRLADLERAILAAVPGSAIASDQPYRVADLAIDVREDVPALSDSAIDRIVGMFQAAGAQAKVSSIHVNGWFGSYDKLSTTQRLLEREFGCDAEAQRTQVAFIGDSPNDQPMFAHYPHSVGVANVRQWLTRLTTPPAYLTRRAAGAGFAEFVDHLLQCAATKADA